MNFFTNKYSQLLFTLILATACGQQNRDLGQSQTTSTNPDDPAEQDIKLERAQEAGHEVITILSQGGTIGSYMPVGVAKTWNEAKKMCEDVDDPTWTLINLKSFYLAVYSGHPEIVSTISKIPGASDREGNSYMAWIQGATPIQNKEVQDKDMVLLLEEGTHGEQLASLSERIQEFESMLAKDDISEKIKGFLTSNLEAMKGGIKVVCTKSE